MAGVWGGGNDSCNGVGARNDSGAKRLRVKRLRANGTVDLQPVSHQNSD